MLATLLLEEDTLFSFQPLAVAKVGISWSFEPTVSVTVPLLPVLVSSLPASASATFTEQLAVRPPSTVVTVIVAVPAAFALSTPPLTLTTASSLEDQVTFWLDASTGTMVAFSVSVTPLAMTTAPWSSITLVTGIVWEELATASVRGSQPVTPPLEVP